jgi:hypothetical protein
MRRPVPQRPDQSVKEQSAQSTGSRVDEINNPKADVQYELQVRQHSRVGPGPCSPPGFLPAWIFWPERGWTGWAAADEAHMRNRYVVVSGVLNRGARISTITDVTGFALAAEQLPSFPTAP